MPVSLHVPGATPEQLKHGVAAACAVFEAANISPWDAALGEWARRSWDTRGFPKDQEPTQAEADAAAIFDDAEQAAFKACGFEAPGRYLEVTPTDET